MLEVKDYNIIHEHRSSILIFDLGQVSVGWVVTEFAKTFLELTEVTIKTYSLPLTLTKNKFSNRGNFLIKH